MNRHFLRRTHSNWQHTTMNFEKLLTVIYQQAPKAWQDMHSRLVDEDIQNQFATNLNLLQQDHLLEKLQRPYFDEEIIPNRAVIFQEFKQLIASNQSDEWLHFFLNEPFEKLLILLGMRFTPASLKTVDALPPPKAQLLHQAFLPYNTQLSQAVRAWEKHVGRHPDNFWGEVSGGNAAKEQLVQQKLSKLLDEATWWNTFAHYKHGIVYEFRVASGHGARWKQEDLSFLGFLEPFLVS